VTSALRAAWRVEASRRLQSYKLKLSAHYGRGFDDLADDLNLELRPAWTRTAEVRRTSRRVSARKPDGTYGITTLSISYGEPFFRGLLRKPLEIDKFLARVGY
jgi:hypothetical protein